MMYTDVLTNDFGDAGFQTAFRTYFGELGCRVTNWEGLFQAMGDVGREYTWTHRDEAGCVIRFVSGVNGQERDYAYVRRDESGEVTGFIQFTAMDMDSWFFTAKCGFVREFWIREDLRGQGHGSALLRLAETWLREQGCICVLLTTSTAPQFYEMHGYRLQRGVRARNQEPVYLKPLPPL